MFKIKSSTRELIIRDGDEEGFFDACLSILMGMRMAEQEEQQDGGGEPPFSPEISDENKMPDAKPILPLKRPSTQTRGFSGFMHLTCEHCGETVTACIKQKTDTYFCNHCGEKTELAEDGMRPAYTKCECGEEAKYLTNSAEGMLDIPCINCGSPVAVEWNKPKRCYTTIK